MFGAGYFGGRYFGGSYFGKVGLTSPAYYFGQGYFGSGYFGARYFSKQGDTAPHTVTVTTGLSAAGAALFGTAAISTTNLHTVTITQGIQAVGVVGFNVSIDSTLGDLFDVCAPLQLSAAGQATIQATISYTIGGAPGVGRYLGGGYFGSYYFGTRYFGTDAPYTVNITSGLSAAGLVTFSVSPSQVLSIVPSALAAAGAATFSVTTNLGIFPVVITQGLQAAGQAAIAADVSQTTRLTGNRQLAMLQGARTLKTSQGARSTKLRRS